MTKKDLEKLNINYMGSKIYPKRFSVPYVGETNLYEPYSIMDIYQKIYERGKEDGIKIGESNKAKEIKSALGIDD
jgi:hypothetical protein